MNCVIFVNNCETNKTGFALDTRLMRDTAVQLVHYKESKTIMNVKKNKINICD